MVGSPCAQVFAWPLGGTEGTASKPSAYNQSLKRNTYTTMALLSHLTSGSSASCCHLKLKPARGMLRHIPDLTPFASGNRRRGETSAVSIVAALFFKGIINRQRVVPHKTIRAVCPNMAAAKKSFYLMHGGATASQ